MGGSWLGCGFGQASRVLWRPGGMIAIAAVGPLGHLTSTCNVGIQYIPLINRVRGPYCKIWTKFFPVDLWPKCKARGP